MRLFDVIDATWPADHIVTAGGFDIRIGKGGGKRVSAATAIALEDLDIQAAEDALISSGQDKLFMIRPDEIVLDQRLEERSYSIIDPVVVLQKNLFDTVHNSGVKFLDEPNSEQIDIWSNGGIGPARLDVMERASGPKAYVHLPGATAFAAISDGIAMAHAVEVDAANRRQGLGRKIMDGICHWAKSYGATSIAVLTVRENAAAMALYKQMGLTKTAHYHYRIKP